MKWRANLVKLVFGKMSGMWKRMSTGVPSPTEVRSIKSPNTQKGKIVRNAGYGAMKIEFVISRISLKFTTVSKISNKKT